MELLNDILTYFFCLVSIGFLGLIVSKRRQSIWEAIVGKDGMQTTELAALIWFWFFATAFYADLFFDKKVSDNMSSALNTVYITTVLGIVGEKILTKK